MTTLQMALVLLVAVLLLAWWWLRRRDSAAEAKDAERLDTLIGWPPHATRVLTTQERVAFGTLVRALPECMILAQVPLARFVSVPKRNSYADWLRRVGYQCADFVVCDMAAQVVAVIELQTAQQSERSRKRLDRISRTLVAAKIPLLLWTEHALPSADAARRAILPRSEPVAAAVPLDTAKTLAETDLNAAADEPIELLEPPPSTWLDELDSAPMPLRKQ